MTQADRVLLDTIGERFRTHPGRIAKQALHHVTDVLGHTDWVTGPGDDTALIRHAQGDVLAAGEAIYPRFVAEDQQTARLQEQFFTAIVGDADELHDAWR